ncbi:MAG: hypothetical protein WD151_15930 [Phycisphaeraceae bacterium]
MRMELAVPAGRTAETVLELRNTTTDETRDMALRLVELSQTPAGSWQLIEPDSETDVSHLSSCRSWISFDRQTIDLEPASTERVTVSLEVPPGARGTYVAGIIAEQPPRPGATGLVVRVRFLIPVIVEIQGRPVRQQVDLDDMEMIYREPADGLPGTTLAGMHVINEGRTYSRIRGEVRVERLSDDRWRPVSRVEIPERGIIPGVTLSLGDDLERRLPSGTYRLRGELYVDGRRVAPLDKEIEFEGDPDVDTLAYDTALILEPAEVAFDATPGAVRTSVVRVENPSEDPLEVRAEAVLPSGLQGVALGELRGDALSAVEWVQVRPDTFTLRGGGRQNLRVLTRVPREDVDHARYYAHLVLHANYADGQSAGTTQTLLTVSNAEVPAEPKVQMERLALASDEESRYIVQTQLSNVGNVHLDDVHGETELLGAGARTVTSSSLSGEAGILLPLGVRQFGGELDFADVEPGQYILQARLRYGEDGSVVKRLAIRVEEEEDGSKSVEILDDEDPDALELDAADADAEPAALDAEGGE